MTFNELNAVEHFIIHQLSGENLNLGAVSEAKPPPYKAEWQYCSSEELDRGVNEVLVESELRKALIRINPEIQQNPALADEVIYKLRAILISVNQTGLVRANEEFTKWLQGEKTMPFGENNRHVPVRLIDFEKLTNNTYIITNQFRVHHRETKIPDIVLLINGIPVVVWWAKPKHRFVRPFPG
jgi:type I restriction enzyme R subunit